jgi:hypothetical protein
MSDHLLRLAELFSAHLGGTVPPDEVEHEAHQLCGAIAASRAPTPPPADDRPVGGAAPLPDAPAPDSLGKQRQLGIRIPGAD